MARDHTLRENSNPKYLERVTGPKEHSDRKPCAGIAVSRGEYYQQADLNIYVFEERPYGIDDLI
jgi:hypothetical protein